MRAVVFGGTGQVGRRLIVEMLKSNTTKKVLSLSRSRLYPLEIAVFDRNLSGHDVHQHMLGKVPKPEDVERETRRLVRGCTHAFSVVGASRKASDDVIEAVDGDLVKAFARGCRDAGTVGHFSLLSQHGAESSSSDVRLRAKGEAENTVLELGFPVTSIYRPYNLLTTLQRSKWKEILLPLLRPVTPPNLRSVSVGDLGKVMFQNASRIHVNVETDPRHLQLRWGDNEEDRARNHSVKEVSVQGGDWDVSEVSGVILPKDIDRIVNKLKTE
ncbi:hypothetical protein AAMO2058_001620500 [Amorphochlora amoebiformis]|uniref:NAD(P)-binding domain-containing protein n=1 Tax=Amorphochlora amoebiformis TaxID=1561963 RepID=A0A7S0DU54_9EUKA|mmetsp:Transcript_6821/g.10585  ORF Transcript_6821/g.10585 Transcript_6821/m.10585 type:complete len:271 (+) Transcript_6821:55-867(+)